MIELSTLLDNAFSSNMQQKVSPHIGIQVVWKTSCTIIKWKEIGHKLKRQRVRKTISQTFWQPI